MTENSNRAEAERLLGIAEKLLQSRDLNGTREFAVLAQETDPLLEGSDQILAVADVLLSSDKRINNHNDWYSILQIDRRSDDHDLIRKQYRRLALLLHPDKNKFPFADQAFKLVADAWAVLSDSSKKPPCDNEITLFSRVDLSNSAKLPVRRSTRPASKKESVKPSSDNATAEDHRYQKVKLASFWTACPYCYLLYEYPRVYVDCCLKCQNCDRAFHAVPISSLPPLVPGKEAYYCCWGFFPLGFVIEGQKNSTVGSGSGQPGGFPNWMPPIFGSGRQFGEKNSGASTWAFGSTAGSKDVNINANVNALPVSVQPAATATLPAPARAATVVGRGGGVVGSGNAFGPKKRGRPRKYPIPGQAI